MNVTAVFFPGPQRFNLSSIITIILTLRLVGWNGIGMRMRMRMEMRMGVEMGIEWNNNFIIMFDTVGNGMSISFYFYVWYNKIV